MTYHYHTYILEYMYIQSFPFYVYLHSVYIIIMLRGCGHGEPRIIYRHEVEVGLSPEADTVSWKVFSNVRNTSPEYYRSERTSRWLVTASLKVSVCKPRTSAILFNTFASIRYYSIPPFQFIGFNFGTIQLIWCVSFYNKYSKN